VDDSLSIGAVSQQLGISKDAIRFYEKKGLIKPPRIKSSRYRTYPPEIVDTIRFIRHAREMGFSLDTTATLLRLRLNPKENSEAIEKILAQHLESLDQGLVEIKTQYQQVKTVLEHCRQRKNETCDIMSRIELRTS
jgi:DNA-binding transcriptional MerR regulator